LGIQVLETQRGISGLTVTSIGPNSLADEAGLKEGDVIVAVDGRPTPTILDIAELLTRKESGDQIRARIVRGTTTSAIMIPLVGPKVASAKPTIESPQQPALAGQSSAGLGIKIVDSPSLRGVVVTEIVANSPADAAGLQRGDRIFSLDGRFLVNTQAFNREIVNRSPGEQLSLQLVRDGALIAADLQLKDPSSLATTTKPKAEQVEKSGESVLGGIGSVLGGLLGGKPKVPSDGKDKNDEMALGDEEPIAQAGFESDVKPPVKELENDPPSLETLELPPATPLELKPPQQSNQAGKPKADDRVKTLQEQIRQLEQKLRELEANR
jgi:membrane-associated protease RseP (regulator of RpoE activity)